MENYILNAKASKYVVRFFCNQMIKEQPAWIRGEEEEDEEEEDTRRNAGVFSLFSALTLRVSWETEGFSPEQIALHSKSRLTRHIKPLYVSPCGSAHVPAVCFFTSKRYFSPSALVHLSFHAFWLCYDESDFSMTSLSCSYSRPPACTPPCCASYLFHFIFGTSPPFTLKYATSKCIIHYDGSCN